MSTRWHVDTVHSRPLEADLQAVADLAGVARTADGHPPFSDQTFVGLRGGDMDGRRVVTLLVRAHDDADAAGAAADGATSGLAGAAVLVAEEEGPPLLELVVAPVHRRRGVGSALLQAAALPGMPRGVRTWSHGDHPAARVLAAAHRYAVVRELWRMSAPVAAVAPADAAAVAPPEGIRLRSFRPGDEAALLDLNAAAFAHHPDQGSLSASDLADLMAQDWFDADGLFLAERDPEGSEGGLLGFHWTKIDPAAPHEGEVYVLGVDPAAQGLGLGRVLTAAGLDHLRRRGVDTITLYVDADNAPAVRLYTGVGFGRADVDVMYAPAAAPAGRQ